MKRVIAVILLLIVFSGCGEKDGALDRPMTLRKKLLDGNGCRFDATITADYGDAVYTFSMECQADAQGNLTFTVKAPETISGITGVISDSRGKLTFDGQALAFAMLADGHVTPVSAPWLLIKTLRSGYLNACGNDGEYTKISIDDSYEADALHLDVWIDGNLLPVRGEILWQGRRVVSLEVGNFVYL